MSAFLVDPVILNEVMAAVQQMTQSDQRPLLLLVSNRNGELCLYVFGKADRSKNVILELLKRAVEAVISIEQKERQLANDGEERSSLTTRLEALEEDDEGTALRDR